MTKYDVIGLGNPMVEIVLEAEDSHLKEFGIIKGTGKAVSNEEQDKILIRYGKSSKTAGDSTANTLSALSILGAKVIYVGKIGDDEDGIIFDKTIRNDRFISRTLKCDEKTGRCIVLVTPDKQRSFAYNLSAAMEIKKEDILEEDIRESRIFHFTGYQLAEPNLKAAALHALELAKKNGLLISFDFADSREIKKNLNEWKNVVDKYVDIIFANEEEAFAFTGLKAEEAVKNIKKNAIVCIKLGEKGSIINNKGKILKIKAKKANAVDTTGAGDAYAAGILFGILRGIPLEKAGELASHISSKVVEQIGARLKEEHIKDIKF
jgi:sugar/nucleoside kinase (ribokinase family)